MKKVIISLLFALFLIPVVTEAKIWRVNNNAGVVADFNSFDAAMAAHAADDTIHLEPSATAYVVSEATIYTNQIFVTIIGNGYFLDNSGNPGLQQNVLSSALVSSLGPGSSSILMNANIKFIGIVFESRVNLVQYEVSNVTYPIGDVYFEHCLFKDFVVCDNLSSTAGLSMNGVHFSKNYMIGQLYLVIALAGSLHGFVFENNICLNDFTVTVPSNHDMSVIRNNVFTELTVCDESFWANNIFLHANNVGGYNPSFPGCVLKNNIFIRNSFDANAISATNNLYGISLATVFAGNVNQAPALLKDSYFQLAPGSPAIAAAVPNGVTPVDIGPFGGPDPYKLSGIPAIPTIYQLQVPEIINTGTDMQINVKSKSNN